MTAQAYTTKSGAKQYRPVCTEDEYRSRTFEDNPGFCLACGQEADGVEPDARRYECESCGARKVFGLEELLMMGLVIFGEVSQ